MNQISKWHPNSQMDFGFFQRSELVWNIRAIIEGSCTVLVIRTAVPSRVWTTATLAFSFYQRLTIFLKQISYEYCIFFFNIYISIPFFLGGEISLDHLDNHQELQHNTDCQNSNTNLDGNNIQLDIQFHLDHNIPWSSSDLELRGLLEYQIPKRPK